MSTRNPQTSCAEMRHILIVNKKGTTLFSRYYPHTSFSLPLHKRLWLEGELIRKCLTRNEKQSSFVEFQTALKVVYRRFGALCFIIGMEENENELSIYEFINAFVEVLESYFNGVSELDLMFNLDRVHIILDEMVLSGHIVEHASAKVLEPLQFLSIA